MDNVNVAKLLLETLGMLPRQQAPIACLTLLAMANITPDSMWHNATNQWVRIHDVILFLRDHYRVTYAENSRETFRKQVMHPFRTGALIEDNGKATNSPNYRYRITEEFLKVIKSIDRNDAIQSLGNSIVQNFLSSHQALSQIYASKKKMRMMPVRINNIDFNFSPGNHNELQKAIIEDFAPRFAPNSECLYIGDTIQKDLVKNVQKLSTLGFEITLHDKMPDVVLYREDENWIYFIEAVTSVGPMNPKRLVEIEDMTKAVSAGKIYITAFLDFATFKKFSGELAWETEVWIASMPDHMIHLNGDRFLGPR
ncbi:BsuBI/PstI family type II restriction endonuclease [Porphyromonas macacae]|uniref:BsuBI/PstI family type II restriction endonuclease n=1 Tax=Porphyromonas macacae TaxID=28115 RepID=UPI0035A0477A